MKRSGWLLMALPLIMISAAHADTSFSVSVGDRNDRWVRPEYRYYPPRRHRRAYITPIVVTPAPYYAGYPYPVTPVPALTGNYGQDISDFRGRLTKLSNLVHRQQDVGTLTSDQADRFNDALNGIDREARERSYNNGGNLSSNDINDLARRLEDVRDDIESTLAE